MLEEIGSHTSELFPLLVDSCCISHLLPDALVCVTSKDTGAEVAQWGIPALAS